MSIEVPAEIDERGRRGDVICVLCHEPDAWCRCEEIDSILPKYTAGMAHGRYNICASHAAAAVKLPGTTAIHGVQTKWRGGSRHASSMPAAEGPLLPHLSVRSQADNGTEILLRSCAGSNPVGRSNSQFSPCGPTSETAPTWQASQGYADVPAASGQAPCSASDVTVINRNPLLRGPRLFQQQHGSALATESGRLFFDPTSRAAYWTVTCASCGQPFDTCYCRTVSPRYNTPPQPYRARCADAAAPPWAAIGFALPCIVRQRGFSS